MPKGRPKGKKATMVTLSTDEFHILAARLGYTDQDLKDDLAIPPTAAPVAPLTATQEVEDFRKSAEVARPRSETNRTGIDKSKGGENIVKKRIS